MLPAEDILDFFRADQSDLATDSNLVDRVEKIVDKENTPTKQRIRELKIRFALHFSPRGIVEDSHLNEKDPRYIVSEQYISENFDFSPSESGQIAKEVQKVLDAWDESREETSMFREKLLRSQSFRCNSCNLHFSRESISYKQQDPFKPYHLKKGLADPVVDHIEPISGLGGNSITNLQVLCKLCNQGKGDFRSPQVATVISNSHRDIETLSWKYRAQILYRVLYDRNVCARCDREQTELSVRLINERGCYIVSNLEPVCVECIYD